MSDGGRKADTAFAFAVLLLLGVLGWRVALLVAARAAPNPADLFSGRPAHPDSARRIVVVDERERSPFSKPEWANAEVYPVPWTGANLRSREGRVAALVRAYGYSALPVLITLTPDGQVVRVQALAPATD